MSTLLGASELLVMLEEQKKEVDRLRLLNCIFSRNSARDSYLMLYLFRAHSDSTYRDTLSHVLPNVICSQFDTDVGDIVRIIAMVELFYQEKNNLIVLTHGGNNSENYWNGYIDGEFVERMFLHHNKSILETVAYIEENWSRNIEWWEANVKSEIARPSNFDVQQDKYFNFVNDWFEVRLNFWMKNFKAQ